jgi:hypothetical protein
MSVPPSNRNVRTRDFKQRFDRLPEHVRRLAVVAFRLFRDDPDHPMLHRHPLGDTHRGQHRAGSFSVWINRQYRAIYVEDGGTNVWYWVGSHSDYNIFTGRNR